MCKRIASAKAGIHLNDVDLLIVRDEALNVEGTVRTRKSFNNCLTQPDQFGFSHRNPFRYFARPDLYPAMRHRAKTFSIAIDKYVGRVFIPGDKLLNDQRPILARYC